MSLTNLMCFTNFCANTTESESPSSPKSLKNPTSFMSFYTQDHDGNTRLHKYMIHSPQYDHLAEKLIDRTWPAVSLLNMRNSYGMTALHLAVMGSSPHIVRQLLVAGANPFVKDRYGCIPLHYVCAFGQDKMLLPLMRPFDTWEISMIKSKKLKIPDLAESIHAQNNEGAVPLHLAAKCGHTNIVKQLLEYNLI